MAERSSVVRGYHVCNAGGLLKLEMTFRLKQKEIVMPDTPSLTSHTHIIENRDH